MSLGAPPASKHQLAMVLNALTHGGSGLQRMDQHDHMNIQALNLRYLQQRAMKYQTTHVSSQPPPSAPQQHSFPPAFYAPSPFFNSKI